MTLIINRAAACAPRREDHTVRAPHRRLGCMGNLLLNLTSPISHCRADSFLGGHVRVGLEGNFYLEKGKLAPSNAALVAKASDIIDILGDQVATPAEACQILGMETKK